MAMKYFGLITLLISGMVYGASDGTDIDVCIVGDGKQPFSLLRSQWQRECGLTLYEPFFAKQRCLRSGELLTGKRLVKRNQQDLRRLVMALFDIEKSHRGQDLVGGNDRSCFAESWYPGDEEREQVEIALCKRFGHSRNTCDEGLDLKSLTPKVLDPNVKISGFIKVLRQDKKADAAKSGALSEKLPSDDESGAVKVKVFHSGDVTGVPSGELYKYMPLVFDDTIVVVVNERVIEA